MWIHHELVADVDGAARALGWATYDGTVRHGDRALEPRDAPGATGRNYGHGERWAWLHADLGDGDVCEVIAAVAARKPMNRLPALPWSVSENGNQPEPTCTSQQRPGTERGGPGGSAPRTK